MSLSLSLHSFYVSNQNTFIYSLDRHQTPKSIFTGNGWCPVTRTRGRIRFWKLKQSSTDNSAYDTSDAHSSSADQRGSSGNDGKVHRESLTSTEILKKLRRYGVSGILSYGLLNTVYYLTAFLLVWFYISPAPGKMGFRAAAERFLKMMAMVWAGSQVTKLFRAAGALAFAPFVDRGLSWFTVKFKFESQAKAFLTIVGFCLGLAVILFLVVTLLSA